MWVGVRLLIASLVGLQVGWLLLVLFASLEFLICWFGLIRWLFVSGLLWTVI